MKIRIFARAILLISSVAIQTTFWVVLAFLLGSYADILVFLLAVLNLYCTIVIIIEDNHPEVKIPWIIVLNMLPIIGGIVYIVFGKQRESKSRKELREKMEQKQKEWMDLQPKVSCELFQNDSSAERLSKYIQSIASSPKHVNTQVEYFKLGEDKFEAMLRELKAAEKFIFFEYFIIEDGKMWGAIEEILIEKASKGVDVRIMFDDLGCIVTLPVGLVKRMKKHNIDCRAFNPVLTLFNSNFNSRDHRKILVIDGNVGFIGGVNIADEYINEKVIYGHWKDTAVMLKGDAVYNLTVMFLSMWALVAKREEDFLHYAPTKSFESDGIIQPFSDTPLDDDAVGETVYMSMLNCAKEYVYITTPYLIISREMMVALTSAAKSGIDVRIILPGIPDKKLIWFLSRSYYKILLKAGVKIYEYTPGFIHAKMFVSDDSSAVVGTINLDYRSLALHYECAVWMYGSSAVGKVKDDFIGTQAQCREITMENHPYGGKLSIVKFTTLGILRTFSSLL